MKKRLILAILLFTNCVFGFDLEWGTGPWGSDPWGIGEYGNSGKVADFYAPLIYNLDLTNGIGTATKSRNSTATVKDYLGNVVTVAAEEMRFEGARRVSEGVWSDKKADGSSISTSLLKGVLIEEQRENLIPYSEAIDNATGGWTESSVTSTLNQALSPDGVNSTATKVVPDAGTGTRGIDDFIAAGSVSDNTVYAFSIFVKKNDYRWVRIQTKSKSNVNVSTWFDLDTATVGTDAHVNSRIEAFGSSWYRISCGRDILNGATNPRYGFRLADADNNTNATGDGSKYNLFWGAQFEEGSFASSYIATAVATATRLKDVLYYTATGNVNENEGSMVCDFNMLGIDASYFPGVLTISDNLNSDYIRFQGILTNLWMRLGIEAGSATQATINTGNNALAFNTDQSMGVSYKINDIEAFLDGASFGTDTVATMPTGLTHIYIGSNQSGGNVHNGTIKEVKIYKKKLSDAQMESLTQ